MSSLYEKLGGEPAIDAVVERFYDLMLQDARVKDIFKNTDMQRQRKMQKAFLNHVLGGKPYHGKSMKEAHRKLHLTDVHFDAVLENMGRAMKELGVADDLIQQVAAIAATTRDDVLGRDKQIINPYLVGGLVLAAAVVIGLIWSKNK
ncbi:globin-like protein [Gorgonomyces haynaldii]|nr:globin-like protein [Gorgonomyces haynaldii]